MAGFDFTDGLKMILVTIFMLGSVQLHALIDESAQRSADRTEHFASQPRPAQAVRRLSDSFDAGEERLRWGPAPRT